MRASNVGGLWGNQVGKSERILTFTCQKNSPFSGSTKKKASGQLPKREPRQRAIPNNRPHRERGSPPHFRSIRTKGNRLGEGATPIHRENRKGCTQANSIARKNWSNLMRSFNENSGNREMPSDKCNSSTTS